MPVLTAAACVPSVACPATPFPVATASCFCVPSAGGINDLYFIPCDQVLSEVNINDAAGWWADLQTGTSPGFSNLGNIGKILGSLGKKTDKKDRFGSCDVEEVVMTTWAITAILKCFDKSTDKVTHQQVNALIGGAKNYLLIARMCDGDNTVLPVGRFVLSDLDWTVTDDVLTPQQVKLELSWNELGLPKTYDVAGLSAVVPKA